MEIPEIDVPQARSLHAAGAAKFVDIRDPGSFQAAHIPGAIHVDGANVEAFVANADLGAQVIVYCYHGNSSLDATAFFRERGFTAVSSLSGGFTAWQGAGGPAEPGA